MLIALGVLLGVVAGLGGVLLGFWLTWRSLRPSEPVFDSGVSADLPGDASENEDIDESKTVDVDNLEDLI